MFLILSGLKVENKRERTPDRFKRAALILKSSNQHKTSFSRPDDAYKLSLFGSIFLCAMYVKFGVL